MRTTIAVRLRERERRNSAAKFRNAYRGGRVKRWAQGVISFRNILPSRLILNQKFQLADWIVIPVVVGSSPISHPKISNQIKPVLNPFSSTIRNSERKPRFRNAFGYGLLSLAYNSVRKHSIVFVPLCPTISTILTEQRGLAKAASTSEATFRMAFMLFACTAHRSRFRRALSMAACFGSGRSGQMTRKLPREAIENLLSTSPYGANIRFRGWACRSTR
jgi:hypothetical protein